MGTKLLEHAAGIQRKLADNHLPHLLVYTTGPFAVVMGLIFFLDAERYAANPTFAFTFKYALPEVWGAVMAATGLLMMFGFWQNRSSGRAPAFILTLVFSILGISSAHEPLANPSGPALLSASAAYTFIAIVCAICIFACSSRMEEYGAQAPDDHLHH